MPDKQDQIIIHWILSQKNINQITGLNLSKKIKLMASWVDIRDDIEHEMILEDFKLPHEGRQHVMLP